MSAMPGFIDAHRHINTGPNEKAQIQAQLEAGYTTILSGGGPAEGNLTLRITSIKASSTDRASFLQARSG
jgi:N-acyl-D-aspartate/D-glutamate deacylase